MARRSCERLYLYDSRIAQSGHSSWFIPGRGAGSAIHLYGDRLTQLLELGIVQVFE